jgi:hypothetical protein
MTLQNVRSLLWRGEDLGYGSGNTREQIINTKVAAAARPLIVTQGFASSQVVTGYLGSNAIFSYNGILRMLMNRSPDFWMTLTAQCLPALGASIVPIQIPIAPLQNLFLPNNIYGPATLSMNSNWPIPQPLAGAGAATVPLATATSVLTFDWLGEA